LSSPASASNPTVLCWLAGSSSPTSGADGAAAKEVSVTPWSAGWRTSRSVGGRPTLLEVVVRRYRCAECGRVWRQDTSKAAEPRAKLSRCGLRWALEAMVVQHLTVVRVAEGLGVAWNTANDAVLAEGKRVLIDDDKRFDGVKVRQHHQDE
jgi:hypothetical protein